MVFHIVNFESQTTNKVMKQKLEITTQTLNFIPKGKQNENIHSLLCKCLLSHNLVNTKFVLIDISNFQFALFSVLSHETKETVLFHHYQLRLYKF